MPMCAKLSYLGNLKTNINGLAYYVTPPATHVKFLIALALKVI
jgi:hypothetical protein